MSSEAKKRSLEAKSRGDDAFRRKDYLVAVDAYTQVTKIEWFFSHRKSITKPEKEHNKTEGIGLLTVPEIRLLFFIVISHNVGTESHQATELDPNDATVLSNRSLCWLRAGQAERALEDAKACRALRPDWAKACYREGAAHRLLQVCDIERCDWEFTDNWAVFRRWLICFVVCGDPGRGLRKPQTPSMRACNLSRRTKSWSAHSGRNIPGFVSLWPWPCWAMLCSCTRWYS